MCACVVRRPFPAQAPNTRATDALDTLLRVLQTHWRGWRWGTGPSAGTKLEATASGLSPPPNETGQVFRASGAAHKNSIAHICTTNEARLMQLVLPIQMKEKETSEEASCCHEPFFTQEETLHFSWGVSRAFTCTRVLRASANKVQCDSKQGHGRDGNCRLQFESERQRGGVNSKSTPHKPHTLHSEGRGTTRA